MKLPWAKVLAGFLAVAVVHLVLGWVSGPSMSASVNFALFSTNLYVLYCAASLLSEKSGRALAMFVGGYLALFGLVMVVLERESLFILLVVVYASVFRSAVLLGFFGIFVLCFVVLQPYAVETFVPLAFIYILLWRARGASPFLLACLGFGLAALSVVLFPLLHLAIQDSAQTLYLTLSRPDVQDAIGATLASSTVATLLVTLFGVPLAYALARVEFAGRRLVESLIDLPILVPHSVAGIALMILLGPGSPLGEALESHLGLRVAGSFAGVVAAQVFVASPFVIKTALAAFEAVPEHLEMAARTLGASAMRTFVSIALPLASRGIAIGMVLAWSRAVSELGAILLFAGSPTTAPVLVHTEFLRAGVSESRPIAIVLLLTCLWIFVILQFGQTLLPFALRRPRAKAVSRS